MLSARLRLKPDFGLVPGDCFSGRDYVRPSFLGDAMEFRVDFILLDGPSDCIENEGVRGSSRA